MFLFSFVLQYLIRSWLKLPTGSHGHVICIGNLRGVFSHENTPEGLTETHKRFFFFPPYKQVSGRNGDHEWRRMTKKFRKVMQRTEKEALSSVLWNICLQNSRVMHGNLKHN